MRRIALLTVTFVALFLSQIGVAEARRHHVRHHHRADIHRQSHPSVIRVKPVPVPTQEPVQGDFTQPKGPLLYSEVNVSKMLQGWHDGIYYVVMKDKPEKVVDKHTRPLGVAVSMLGVVLLGFGICYGLDRRLKREKYDSGAYKE